MTFVLNISVPAFNLIRYLIVSLGLGILSEAVGDSLERVRRSMSLLREGKVLIGARKNRLFRTVSFGASPSVLIASILLTIAILASEASLEFSSDSISIGVPIKAKLRWRGLGDIRRYTAAKLYLSVISPVLSKADICATKMGDSLVAWNTSLYTLETGDDMTERSNCPRNLTTSHLLENTKGSHVLELAEIRNATTEMAASFRGTTRSSFDGSFFFANLSMNVSGRFSEIWANFSREEENGYQLLGLLSLRSLKPHRTLECLVLRAVTMAEVSNRLHGCTWPSANSSRYVYYQSRNKARASVPPGVLWTGELLGATITEKMDAVRRGQVLSAGMRAGLHPPLKDALFLTILGRMAFNGELARRHPAENESMIGFSEILRPAVQEWSVGVFFSTMFGLIFMAVCGNLTARRLFPIHKMVGEQNLLRKWAMEKETARYGGLISGKLGDINEKKIWLCTEQYKNERCITVSSGDPEHRTVEPNSTFTYDASPSLVRN